MSEQLILFIPAELSHPFFFSANDRLTIEKEQLEKKVLNIPFLYEAAFYAKIEALKPWQSHEEFIPLLKKEWDNEKNKLEKIFKDRRYKDAVAPMKKGIGLFFQFVYWANGQPVNFSMPITSESIKVQPVNLEERMGFITQRPALYHSFIQLNELIIEMEKQYVKYLAMKKASKQ